MPESNCRIMVVEDDLTILRLCQTALQSWGYHVSIFQNSMQAAEEIEAHGTSYDLILSDFNMPRLNGLQILEQVQKYTPDTPTIIITAFGSVDNALSTMRAGAFEYILKPFKLNHLRTIIEKGLEQRRLFQERQHLHKLIDAKYAFANIIGKSGAIRKIFDTISQVGPSDTNVLITGESGTGKELVARAIHANGNRRSKPFIPINCAAIPESLFESEIFGHEKGAFTGANHRKIGLLESAHHGTFFMDEVFEMPELLQIKLLRVLQDQQLRRVGGNELIQVDARLIAASNKNPETALKEGLIREDFYYRLNVIQIELPPLRDRYQDIRPLALHFLQNNLKETQKNIQGFSEAVLQLFENYSWPGNIRELENVVERAVTLTRGDRIEPDILPAKMRLSVPNSESFDNMAIKFETVSLTEAKQQAIDHIEKKYLDYLLKKHQGNITLISKESGMTRRNIYRLLSRHNLDPDQWRA